MVTGNIRAKRAVELHAPARVKGNIETPSLYVDKGVMFEGSSKMENLQPGAGTNIPRTLQGLAEAAAKPAAGGTTAAAPPPPATVKK
jgi:cytoskeletal protein CcmA (bactofilin family)